MLLAVVPATQSVHAQEGGVPQEMTVSELREALGWFMAIDRSRAMLGLPDLEGTRVLQVQLLQADFDENVLPGLEFAEQDCFFAEQPVRKATDWARQVQLLGYDVDFGPLWEEADVVQESLVKILHNCHKQLYQRCLLDQDDPNVDALPGVTRQLGYYDDDPIYPQRSKRCEIGWNGTLTLSESMQGSQSKTQSMAGSSVTTKLVVSGNRDLRIETLGRGQPTTGTVEGRNSQTTTTIATAGKCTFTSDLSLLKVGSGSGEATLFKHSNVDGELILSFTSPLEQGRQTTTGRSTVNDTNCGSNASIPDQSTPLPSPRWPGQIREQLGDPYTEVVEGSKTIYWVVNAAGLPTPARGSDGGGVSRVPAVPGAPPLGLANQLLPWLQVLQTAPDLDGEPPTIKMDIHWSLVFGGGE